MMTSRRDVLKMLAFVAVRYVRVVVDGFILRRNGLIFTLAGRNASAMILLVLDACATSRKDAVKEENRSRRLMLAGVGAIGCSLLASDGNDVQRYVSFSHRDTGNRETVVRISTDILPQKGSIFINRTCVR